MYDDYILGKKNIIQLRFHILYQSVYCALYSALPYIAVVVSAAPVRLGSSATLTCSVDPSMLQEGISVSSLEYQWTVDDDVMQQRSSFNTFFIGTAGVSDARDDYGCDVFTQGQPEPLFDRALGRLQVNSMLNCCVLLKHSYLIYFIH